MTSASFFETSYDRAACDIGVVHIGYGAFHRAHQAVYLDDYMQATGDLRWAIAAVNLRDTESAAFAQTAESGGEYLLKTISPDGTLEFRKVRSHQQFADATLDFETAASLLARPSVTAATITVTESGYSFSDDWSLDVADHSIEAELSGGSPQTIYGYLSAALRCRAEAIDAPISILCCDNIRNNGNVLKHALLAYLEAGGQRDLADWVGQNATFPCSMVDRITPRSTAALQDEVRQLFPSCDSMPIHAESFSQWVLQDDFAADMPDLSNVGVQIVDDVDPYEEAKIRILNGGHTGLAYLGALAGHETFDQAMRDAALRDHFNRWERDEVLTGLGASIPFDTSDYLSEIENRFENRGIADQLERICTDGYSKMAIYIRPTLRACLQKGIAPRAGYDCVASWVVFARHVQSGVTKIQYHEPLWNRLKPMIAKGREHDIASDPQLWGDLPKRFDSFVPNLVSAIQKMDEQWQA